MKRILLSHRPGSTILLPLSRALLGLSALRVIGGALPAADAAAGPTPRIASSADRQQARRTRGRSLALQPEAFKLGRRLGRRFREAGREVSVFSGTLTSGGESQTVVIRRVQEEAGESLEVALG